jgi:hypothetical protein
MGRRSGFAMAVQAAAGPWSCRQQGFALMKRAASKHPGCDISIILEL